MASMAVPRLVRAALAGRMTCSGHASTPGSGRRLRASGRGTSNGADGPGREGGRTAPMSRRRRAGRAWPPPSTCSPGVLPAERPATGRTGSETWQRRVEPSRKAGRCSHPPFGPGQPALCPRFMARRETDQNDPAWELRLPARWREEPPHDCCRPPGLAARHRPDRARSPAASPPHSSRGLLAATWAA